MRITLSNGLEMPRCIQGLPLIMGKEKITYKEFFEIIKNSILNNIMGFDTSHDYGKSEEFIGKSISELIKAGEIKREDVFITSKIGNSQQYEGEIEDYIDESLQKLKVEYIDCMLLHWPVPNIYIDNWRKLEKVYNNGKVKSIGLANAKVRHIVALEQSDVNIIPHVIQTEIHPFNTNVDLRDHCFKKNIALQACSPLCQMIPEVTDNSLLRMLSNKYGKSIAQLMLRWSLQQNINPVFRAFKVHHIKEMSNLFSFNISSDDMVLIDSLNQNYRFHPESSNCAGF